MENIVLVESTTEVCSVAIYNAASAIIAEKHSSEGYKHSEYLSIYIIDCIKQADLKLSDLSAIAMSNGPGSYTGLRVGCSVAKGLCLGLDIPLIAVSTLEAMASEYFNKNHDLVLPMIDARRMEVYTAYYSNNGTCIKDDHNLILDESLFLDLSKTYESTIIIGNGASKAHNFELPDNIVVVPNECRAVNLARIAAHKYASKEFVELAYHEPFYLKSANVTTPKKKIL